MKSNFLKEYWKYRKEEDGDLSMAQWSQRTKELDAESRYMKMDDWRKLKVKLFRETKL